MTVLESVIDWSMTICLYTLNSGPPSGKCHWPVNDVLLMDIPLWELMDKRHWPLSQWHMSISQVSKSVIDRGQWHKKMSFTISILSSKIIDGAERVYKSFLSSLGCNSLSLLFVKLFIVSFAKYKFMVHSRIVSDNLSNNHNHERFSGRPLRRRDVYGGWTKTERRNRAF